MRLGYRKNFGDDGRANSGTFNVHINQPFQVSAQDLMLVEARTIQGLNL
jgi:hypothetical protein